MGKLFIVRGETVLPAVVFPPTGHKTVGTSCALDGERHAIASTEAKTRDPAL